MVGMALAGLVLGLGGVTAGSSFVQASERGGLIGFLEEIFRGPAPQVREPVAVPVRARTRYSSLPDDRRIAAARTIRQTPRPVANLSEGRRGKPRAERRAAPSVASTASAPGARTVCVRACDGYLFPLGHLAAKADLPVHAAACTAACPNAPTRVFTLAAGEPDLDRAVGLDGQPYRSLAVANLYRAKRVDHCSCQPDGVAATPLPIEQDLTARPGDVVATVSSARIVTPARTGGLTTVDFRDARGLSRRARRDIDGKVDVVRREADARALGKALRQADRGARVQLAQAEVGSYRAGGFGAVERGGESDTGFAVVRVVVPSPFAR